MFLAEQICQQRRRDHDSGYKYNCELLHVNGMHIEKVEVQGDYRIKDGTPWIYEKVVVHARRFPEAPGPLLHPDVHDRFIQ